MSDSSTIEWTNATWNPVRGCAIVSKGCTNCYAMRQAHRFSGPGRAYEGLTKLTKGGPVWTGEVRTVPELLGWPLHKRRPLRIFVNSMSDLFHEDVPDTFIARVWWVMGQCAGFLDRSRARGHTFQILTKRADRMRSWVTAWGDPSTRRLWVENLYSKGHGEVYDWMSGPKYWPDVLPNVHLGVSVEDQAAADERIPLLLQTPAAVRWISAEPLLGPVNFDEWFDDSRSGGLSIQPGISYRDAPAAGLDWVVAGGESGPGARPMHPDWARSLRDQCAAAGVAFFFKQWGNWTPCLDDGGHVASPREQQLDGQWMLNVGKHAGGRLLDGREHNEYPA